MAYIYVLAATTEIMLHQTFFNSNDTDRFQSLFKKFQTFSNLVLIIGTPLEILIGYIATRKSPSLFWIMALIGLAILFSIYYFVFFKRLKLFKQDINEQTKLAGVLEVISKSEKDKLFIVNFNSDDLNQTNLSKDQFDKINIGDNLTVEFAKYSKYIFKISKGEELIVSGG